MRFSGVYDAYEAWAILDGLYKRIAQAGAWADKQTTNEYTLAYEPRWKQLLSGGYRARSQEYFRELPEGDVGAVLNVPSPFTAVEARRAAGREAVSAIAPLTDRNKTSL